MGGSSSKPAFESARSVIARRKEVVKSEVVSEAINSVTIIQKPSAVYVDSSNTEGYSADALNTMGNWGDYVVSTSYQVSSVYPTISAETLLCHQASYNFYNTHFWAEP